MDHLEELRGIIGQSYVLTGKDTAKWAHDWTGAYTVAPRVVLRPANTAEVSQIMMFANRHALPVVPVSGNTGLTGATSNDGALMLSLDRLNALSEVDPNGRTITAGAGAILSSIHAAAEAHDLIFPLTFGAKGSAMIGGALSTNAGGSNVVRYGNTRDLCLGLEVVMADGQIMNLMGALHKDNSGYDLKHLMIGAEGTLGIITGAVMKLFTKPRAYATAMVATHNLEDALSLLHDVQDATGGAVEAFEYMPRAYIERHMRLLPGCGEPFSTPQDINIMIEVGATAEDDAKPNDVGKTRVSEKLEDILGDMFTKGTIIDAVVAQNEAQRATMWKRRDDAGEITFQEGPFVNTDIALPLEKVAPALSEISKRVAVLDPDAHELVVAHLGDGNVHHTSYINRNNADLKDALVATVEDVVQDMGGSFSAEHGVGVSKLNTMSRRKDPVALATMKAIKQALDPKGILNPGKVIPHDV